MSDTRTPIDESIKELRAHRLHLGSNARFVRYPVFEIGVVEVLNKEEALLTQAQASTFLLFKKTLEAPGVIEQQVKDSASVVERTNWGKEKTDKSILISLLFHLRLTSENAYTRTRTSLDIFLKPSCFYLSTRTGGVWERLLILLEFSRVSVQQSDCHWNRQDDRHHCTDDVYSWRHWGDIILDIIVHRIPLRTRMINHFIGSDDLDGGEQTKEWNHEVIK